MHLDRLAFLYIERNFYFNWLLLSPHSLHLNKISFSFSFSIISPPQQGHFIKFLFLYCYKNLKETSNISDEVNSRVLNLDE